MPDRQPPIPTVWLMTDERMGEGLWAALNRLPRGAGVVFRHYRTPAAERARLFRRLVRVARRRGLIVVQAGTGCGYGARGTHGPGRRKAGLRTAPAHSMREAARTARHADALFVSPVYSTRSHPGAAALGVRRARVIARALPVPVIALGGMDAKRFARLRGFYGWAAIDAWGNGAGGAARS